MEKQTMIEKHLSGTLSGAEQKQFDSWMKDDKGFRGDVKFQRNVAAVAKDHEKDELKQRLGKVESEITGSPKKMYRRILFIGLGVLLLVIAFLGYRMEKMKASPAGIYASNYEIYPNVYHPVTRGNSDKLTQAFMAYENANYGEAVDLFTKQLEKSRSNEIKFYRALSYGELGDFNSAIKDLADISRFDTDYLDESLWYLGLYYSKQGNNTSAVSRLQMFYELSDDVEKKEAAKRIIYQLQEVE